MSTHLSGRRRTSRPLIFNDPAKGKEFEIPAGEPYVLVKSLKDAVAWGYLNDKDDAAMWAARTNLQRGYVLIWIRGALRGVQVEALEQALADGDSAEGSGGKEGG